MVVLVATSLAFETTDCLIFSTATGVAFLLATGGSGDAFLFGIAATGVAWRAVVTAFLAADLTTDAALATDFAGCFAVFAAPDRAATGTFALTAAFASVLTDAFFATAFDAFVDSTPLFAGVFFAAGFAFVFAAGFKDSANALTIFFAKVFTGDADLTGAFFAAGFVRTGAMALGAIFFVLLADFVTVAFMVPCPSMNLPTLRLVLCVRTAMVH